jgi:uncharacterized membrane protein
MWQGFMHWVRKHYFSVVGSIAFFPVLIASLFLAVSILMVEVDFSDEGQQLKLQSTWIRLRDADTARIIVSTITAGLISLTVFSFSMVMIVLNQAASYMSNRLLENLIGNRSQQLTLGTYIGTIVYALFLLSSIRDIDSGTNIPSLSIFLLIFLTVIDIFIFIYFLHFITQSIKYQTIIHRIAKETQQAMDKEECADPVNELPLHDFKAIEVLTPATGYYQGFDHTALLKQAVQFNLLIHIPHAKGAFLLEGHPFMTLHTNALVTPKQVDALLKNIDFFDGQPIEQNPFYGFKQLVEVAIKALSPGINDPSTAVLSLQALTKLMVHRLHHPAPNVFGDNAGNARIFQKQYSFGELFYHCVQPIWNYGKEDQFVQDALHDLLLQLKPIIKDGTGLLAVDQMLQEVDVARNLRP